MLRELDELDDAIMESGADWGEPDVGFELADVANYLIMMLDDLAPQELARADRNNVFSAPAYEHRRLIHKWTTTAFEQWRKSEPFEQSLRTAFEHVLAVAHRTGLDLHQLCDAKMAIVAARPRLHGGKHPDT